MSEPTSNIRDSINNGPMTFAQIIIVTIAFILNCIDGVDVVAVSVAAPVLSQDWQISPVQTGYILSAALIGMCLGAIFLAPLTLSSRKISNINQHTDVETQQDYPYQVSL